MILDGLFIDATPVMIDTCRLAALMIEPCMYKFLSEKSDPPQNRQASDTPALRASNLAQECLQELTRLHNDVNFVPEHNASITMYAPDIFISTAQPAEQRDYAWIATTFRDIKKDMGTLVQNFNSSGDLENGLGDADRDNIFWNNFAKKQPLWMYIYFLWDHGRNTALAWNTIVLPEDQMLDVGANGRSEVRPRSPQAVSTTVSSSSKKRKKAKTTETADENSLDSLVQVSQKLLERIAPPASETTASTSSTTEGADVQRALALSKHAAALSDHADVLKKQLEGLPTECSGVKDELTKSLTKVLQDLCMLTAKQV
jgi:hypothetical protein